MSNVYCNKIQRIVSKPSELKLVSIISQSACSVSPVIQVILCGVRTQLYPTSIVTWSRCFQHLLYLVRRSISHGTCVQRKIDVASTESWSEVPSTPRHIPRYLDLEALLPREHCDLGVTRQECTFWNCRVFSQGCSAA